MAKSRHYFSFASKVWCASREIYKGAKGVEAAEAA